MTESELHAIEERIALARVCYGERFDTERGETRDVVDVLRDQDRAALLQEVRALIAKEAHLIDEQDRVRGLNIEYRDELEMARRSIGELDAENIALRAKEAQRGEVKAACPRCHSFEVQSPSRPFRCLTCWERFPEPAYFQRVSKPDPAPEEP